MKALFLALALAAAFPAGGARAQEDPRGSPETGAGLSAPSTDARTAEPRAPEHEAPPGSGPASSLGDPRPDGRPRAQTEEAPAGPEAAPWGGPRVELGYAHYVLVDGFGGGDVHAGYFGGYLPTGRVRLGGNAELGLRDYALGQSDVLLRASVLVGYQHLPTRPFVPYAGVVGTAGILLGKRFRTPVAHGLFGAGIEIGADLALVRTLYVGVGLSYLRAALDGPGYDLWVVRLRIGL